MELSNKTARQLYEEVKAAPARKKFGFGEKAALINIDVQKAYTRTDLYKTAYETDPNQINYINELAALMRARNWPVVWTYVAYMASGEDCGIWGTRTDTPDSLQNIKFGSDRAKIDERCQVDYEKDVIYCKKMPSPFHDSQLVSLLTWHKVDTVLITGGSTSGCVRACGVDSLSHGYRTIVVEECVADKHESYHFANLTDLALKYADVESVAVVKKWLQSKN
ncbi:MAG: isochorismatase family protein [Alphaproteobacteria bacterium]|nr:isochorismatase family protein [Alphaproteobacteria bacterium]